MSRVVETSRLTLRPFEPGDVDPLFAIQGDAQVMRYTFWAPVRADSERYLTAYAALYEEHGFAPWTMILRAEQRVVAWGGLSVDPFNPGWGVEVSYFVHPAYAGQGIASEIVQASLQHGFMGISGSPRSAPSRGQPTSPPSACSKRQAFDSCATRHASNAITTSSSGISGRARLDAL
jgi:GNAT superfamily N-acetyltransferase